MKIFRIFGLLTALAVSAVSPLPTAVAGSRYATPPPAVLSPDLTAPWVLQLQYPPVSNQQVIYGHRQIGRYQVRVAPEVRFQPAPRRIVRSRPTYQPVARQPVRQPVVANTPASPRATDNSRQFDPRFEPQIVSYSGGAKPGTVVIDTADKYLYLVMGDGQARRYGVGVGRAGFEWSGTNKISRKAQWPDWRPPSEMIAREKTKGRILPPFVAGGPENPLGARALYLGDTLYRIHGTNRPWTIGKAVSSGCIRMRNEDVMDLYERVGVGTRVVVS